MSTPTQDQIKTAQKNLQTMRALNDYIYIYAEPKIFNAFLLISAQKNDRGAAIAFAIFLGVFRASGGFFGPIGAVVSNIFGGIIQAWSSNPPPDLNKEFSDLIDRLEKTSISVRLQLATYLEGLNNTDTFDATWNTQFTYNGKTFKISDLADSEIPDENSTAFVKAATAGIKAWDQQLWMQLLMDDYNVYWWGPKTGENLGKDKNVSPIPQIQKRLSWLKYTYYDWWWQDASGCSCWRYFEYDISLKSNFNSPLSDDACDYLFIDS